MCERGQRGVKRGCEEGGQRGCERGGCVREVRGVCERGGCVRGDEMAMIKMCNKRKCQCVTTQLY